MNKAIHIKGILCPKKDRIWSIPLLKYLIVMKLSVILVFAISLQAYGHLYSQQVSLNVRKAPLQQVLDELRAQSGYDFFYDGDYMATSKPLSLRAEKVDILQVLPWVFADQPFDYVVNDKIITLIPKKSASDNPKAPQDSVRGTVTDSLGTPLRGVTVRIVGTNQGATTNAQGAFGFHYVPENAKISFSYIGYQRQEIAYTPGAAITVILQTAASSLEETVIIGYGETTKRLNTGSVSTISAKEIEQQPVTNVLSALSGRMPGVFVQTTNGLPGGNINIQIRGTGSIAAGTNPLYIIDGVPFDGGAINENRRLAVENIGGALSPLNSLNPNDIESITVLKDADATAIYGSRGSNGVVLITTKRGKEGNAKISVDIQQGINQVANYPKLLNFDEYLLIRQEAFANDGRTPSADPTDWNSYAPDLTLWSQTESTDWAKYLFGNTANLSSIQAGISGGNGTVTFNLSANHRSEGTILPGNNRYNRSGMRAQVQHNSTDGRFSVNFSGTYNADNNRLANPANSTEYSLLLSPNYPLFNSDGTYNWYAGANPLAQIQATSKANSDNIIGNLLIRYSLLEGLNLKTSLGYNKLNLDQTQVFPSESLYPGTVNYTNFGDEGSQSIIIEPQLDYQFDFENSKLAALIGATYQRRNSKRQYINASNFANESLMENLSSAGTIDYLENQFTEYRYASAFGRITYSWQDRYILNGTLRRDGSSRFSPENRYGTFAAIGAAWLFGSESGVRETLPFLSYGKLRTSYGTTGNDQITDYQYLATYQSLYNYQGVSTLQPSRILNPENYHWETTKKIEAAVELGFMKDRLLINVNHYRNRSDDQLVNYDLPRITGFSSYQANLPAVVQNTGWEFELQSQNIQNMNFKWATSFNLTLPKNKLVGFENFENSSYSNTLEIGYDITRIIGYQLLQIDPQSGLPQYADENGQAITNPYWYHTLGKRTPDFYGGIGNHFEYSGFQLDVFGQFSRQDARGGIAYAPGVFIYNNYSTVLNRWQQPGDITDIPKSSTGYDFYYTQSSANFFNVPYFRIKNISFSYRFPQSFSRKLGSDLVRLYFDAQNPYTFWDKDLPLLDPESGGMTSTNRTMPPVKTFVLGLQLTI